MITIEVDVAAASRMIGDRLLLVAANLKEAIPQQLLLIQSTWIAAVSGHELPGMSGKVVDERYAAMIATPEAMDYPFNGSDFEGRVIMTDGEHADRVELGYPSYDMKPGLLAGPNAKMGEHGPYNTVPFTHSTPGSEGQKGTPMPGNIYAQAAKLADGQRLKGLGQEGVQTKSPFQVNAQAKIRGIKGPMTSPYTWKNSPWEGMVKVHEKGHTSYMTFRRVSGRWTDAAGKEHGSDPNSWMHPGREANPVMQAVADYVEPLIRAALAAAVQNA